MIISPVSTGLSCTYYKDTIHCFMPSIPEIQALIDNAQNTGTGVAYGGPGGLLPILTDLLDKVRDRSPVPVATIGQVAFANPANGQVLLVNGIGYYVWVAVSLPAQAGDIPAYGGAWRLYLSLPAAPYTFAFASGENLSVNLPHNLGTLTPIILVRGSNDSGGTGSLTPPYTYISPGPDTYSVTITDANNTQINVVSLVDNSNYTLIAIKP